MGKLVRLYRHPDAGNTVGIPIDGELYEADAAKRLIGQGIATREAPPRLKRKPKTTPPAEPAAEG